MEITYQGLRIQLPFEGVIGIESFSMVLLPIFPDP